MKKLKCLVIAVSVFGGLNTQLSAMDTIEGTQADLYSLERDGDKFVRLNRKTGQLSVCKFSNEDLVCRLANDERDSLLKEIEQLTELVDELSIQNNNNKTTQKKTDSEFDAEIDKAIDYSSKIMRRFFETMKDIREDFKKVE